MHPLLARRAERRPIRVVLAEDNRLYAQALALALDRDERLTIIGHAADGAEAVTLAGALHPDVVVMDLFMPVLDGFEATRRIRAEFPRTRVVVLTSSRELRELEGARAAGADAWVTKDAASADLSDLVHTIVRAAVRVRREWALTPAAAAL